VGYQFQLLQGFGMTMVGLVASLFQTVLLGRTQCLYSASNFHCFLKALITFALLISLLPLYKD
jgi:hypothetical protein